MASENWNADSVSLLRYELGLTQQDFAQTLGVRQQTVSDWETGLHRPTGGSVKLLSIVKEQAARYSVVKRPRRDAER